jgi:chromate transport protein ChrA
MFPPIFSFLEERNPSFWEQTTPSLGIIFKRFFKLGATGHSGPRMIGQIREALVNQYGWAKEGEFMRCLALCQKIGIFFPSFFILIILIPYYDQLEGVETVRIIERGILGSFIGMLGLVFEYCVFEMIELKKKPKVN